MHPLLEQNREALADLCRRHGVRTLEAFGSVLRDDFELSHSDVDILVEFQPEVASSFTNFLDLKEALETLLQRRVDLIEPQTIRNRRLRFHIDQNKASLYAAA